jgi:hypothetical protein
VTIATTIRLEKPIVLYALAKAAAELEACGVPMNADVQIADVEDGRLLEIRARWS